MWTLINRPLRRAALVAALLAPCLGGAALAQGKSSYVVPDLGRFVALADNSKGMFVFDDMAKPGADGSVQVGTWLVLPPEAPGKTRGFDALYMLQRFDCRARTERYVVTGRQDGFLRSNETMTEDKGMKAVVANTPTAAIMKEACDPAPSNLPAVFDSYEAATRYARLAIKSRNEVWDKGGAAAASGRFELMTDKPLVIVLEGQPEALSNTGMYGRVWLMYREPQGDGPSRLDSMAMLYAVDCSARRYRLVRAAGFLADQYVTSSLSDGVYKAAAKGSAADIVVQRFCGGPSPTGKVVDTRAKARGWVK
jgi:hypothetical protein